MEDYKQKQIIETIELEQLTKTLPDVKNEIVEYVEYVELSNIPEKSFKGVVNSFFSGVGVFVENDLKDAALWSGSILKKVIIFILNESRKTIEAFVVYVIPFILKVVANVLWFVIRESFRIIGIIIVELWQQFCLLIGNIWNWLTSDETDTFESSENSESDFFTFSQFGSGDNIFINNTGNGNINFWNNKK